MVLVVVAVVVVVVVVVVAHRKETGGAVVPTPFLWSHAAPIHERLTTCKTPTQTASALGPNQAPPSFPRLASLPPSLPLLSHPLPPLGLD